MEVESEDEEPLPSSFFEGRFLIEIVSWDWPLHLATSRKHVPREYTFQGGLDYGRWIEVEGKFLAPIEFRGQLIRLHVSPFGPEEVFGPGGWDRVGWFYYLRPDMDRRGYSASLMAPEAEMAALAIRLAHKTKYIDLWTFGFDIDQAFVDRYCFSSNVAKKGRPWAGME